MKQRLILFCLLSIVVTITVLVGGKLNESHAQQGREAHQEVLFQELEPMPCFTYSPESGEAPLTVYFDGSCTLGAQQGWLWDFGDGGTANSSAPSHTYYYAGNFTVSLTTWPGVSETHTIYVSNPPSSSEACFDFSPSSGESPLTVNFNGSCSQNAMMYEWDYDDGGGDTGEYVSHTFYTPGDYYVTLEVAPGASITHIVTVNSPSGPVACFVPESEMGTPPLVVNFSAACSQNAERYDWDFGDGTTGSGVNPPEHTYSTIGTYTVTLTIADGASVNHSVRVIRPPTNACFSYTPLSGDAPLTVSFDATCSQNPDAYDWNFGDGTSGTGQTTTHIYTTPGTYTAALTIAPGYSVGHTVVVTEPPNVACFTYTPTSGVLPMPVLFNASCSQNPLMYEWDFGDGSGGTGANPSHTYQASGMYTITLAVAPGIITSHTITVLAPVACFTESTTMGIAPLTITFNPSCTPANRIQYYQWDFGDGTPTESSSGGVIAHTYRSFFPNLPTAYTVQFCIAPRDCRTHTIQVFPQPRAAFVVDYTERRAYENFTVTNQSIGTYDYGIFDFGDGSTVRVTQSREWTTYQYGNVEVPTDYTIRLTLYDDDTIVDETSQSVQVNPMPRPLVDFAYTTQESPIHQKCFEFRASVSGVGIEPESGYEWQFADGLNTTLYGGTVSHCFVAPPYNWDVTLLVDTPSGPISATKTINGEDVDPDDKTLEHWACEVPLMDAVTPPAFDYLTTLFREEMDITIVPTHHVTLFLIRQGGIYPSSDETTLYSFENSLDGPYINTEPGDEGGIYGGPSSQTPGFLASGYIEWNLNFEYTFSSQAQMEQSLGVSIPAVAEAGVNVSVSYGGEITLSVGFRATSICPSDTSGWHLESVQGSASNPVSPIIASAPIPPSEMAVTYFRDGNSVWVYSHRLNKRFPLPWG